MPVVLVHGNPESPAIWNHLRARLGRDDVITPRLPGFGCPVPDGFGATKEEYVEWLAGELTAIGEPVDLVGHDWGGGFVLRLACTRPDLIRTWASDVAGLLHPDYVWHDFAQIWQTPGAGEEFFAASVGQPAADRAAMYETLGIPSDVAADLAVQSNALLGDCVLKLYRSAAQPAMRAWGDDAAGAAARPGLVIVPSDDPFTGGPERAAEMAVRLGARTAELPNVGHWWMFPPDSVTAAVTALAEHWASA